MSYGPAAALQQAIYERLKADADVAAAVGDAIYDVVPPGKTPSIYISIGPEDVRDRSDKTGQGAQHDFTISVVTDAAGFQSAKRAAAAVSDALVDARLDLARGTLVWLAFMRARARRTDDARRRRIDLQFRARVEDHRPTTSEIF